MRFHHLTMTAFGPYAGREDLDFETLNEAGVFLLTGPTGAGKTSILDALCFALYGVVPGDRGVRTLRSQHAEATARPEVTLELTLGERRYRIHRSPEWQRPKKRGSGFTTEQASARLIEIAGDEERLVSSRIQEVGHELSLLVGMSATQFTQVVLLPQGQFQTFLRATSDERQAVLERLFHTERFGNIETWMAERSKSLQVVARTSGQHVRTLLATLAHRAQVELPPSLANLDPACTVESVRLWAGGLVERATAELAHRQADEAAATAAWQAAESQCAQAEQHCARAERRRAAEATLQELTETAAEEAEAQAAVEAHERAMQVAPLVEAVHAAARGWTQAGDRRKEASLAVSHLPGPLRPSAGEAAGDRGWTALVAERRARVHAVLPREEARAVAAEELDTARAALSRCERDLETAGQLAAQLPARVEQVAAALHTTRQQIESREMLRAELTTARERLAAALELPRAEEAHAKLVRRLQDARETALSAREAYLDVVERRLAGMAAELSAHLVDGEPCAVCGSSDHPAPAQSSPDAVSAETQRAAQRHHDELGATADLLAQRVEESSAALAAVRSRAATMAPEDGTRQVERLEAELRSAEDAVARLVEEEEARDQLQGSMQNLEEQRAAAQEARTTLHARVGALQATVQTITAEVHAVVGDDPRPLAEVLAELDHAVTVLTDLDEAVAAEQEQLSRLEDARARADAASRARGFADTDAVQTATLTEEQTASLRAEVQRRGDERRAAHAVLADTGVDDEESQEPDLAALRDELDRARAQARAAADRLASATETSAAITDLDAQLEQALAAWEPARDTHAVAEGLASLVRGVSSDNQLQMRLSSYVLATRLDQVLEAANDRLGHMRDQRYQLRRTDRVQGRRRAGLGVEVLDGWTGEARATTTLSGGETFVISLALALGLADVVGEESGGTQVDTLFVDEGFGMLDPDTLDDVMDRIDELRSGGRTVGVVSHVSELRSRIPTQVQVHRARHGSHVELRTLTA